MLSQDRPKLASVLLSLCLFLAVPCGAAECVVLLHGLIRTEASMEKMARMLAQQGYKTVNIDYPSRKKTIEALSAQTIPRALKECGNSATVHFVTHSMGGILLRQYLTGQRIKNLGHTVMLAPPNHGSEVVDILKDVPGFELLNGPAGRQLGTEEESVPRALGPANFSLGVIAGTWTTNIIMTLMLPKPNDGKVSVESTRLEGMSDHITLPVTHSLMMRDPLVIQQTIHFLSSGRFHRNSAPAPER